VGFKIEANTKERGEKEEKVAEPKGRIQTPIEKTFPVIS